MGMESKTLYYRNEYRSWIEKEVTLEYRVKDNDMIKGSVTHNDSSLVILRNIEKHMSYSSSF
jgi:hypothetical protein